MSTWLKNNLIKSWFLRRVGHWFMAWKVKWRAPGLRRKFGHKFTHIFYFHRGEVAKFLKVELFLRCPENHFFLQVQDIYLSKLSRGALCVRIKCLELWQRGFRPLPGLFLFDQMDFAVFQTRHIAFLTYCGWRGMAMHEEEVGICLFSWNSEEQKEHTSVLLIKWFVLDG